MLVSMVSSLLSKFNSGEESSEKSVYISSHLFFEALQDHILAFKFSSIITFFITAVFTLAKPISKTMFSLVFLLGHGLWRCHFSYTLPCLLTSNFRLSETWRYEEKGNAYHYL